MSEINTIPEPEPIAAPEVETTAPAQKPRKVKKTKAKPKTKKTAARKAAVFGITVPQARVLKALASKNGSVMTRAKLAKAAGFSPISGTINRAMHGYKNPASGSPYPGLLEAGLVDKVPLDIDGVTEVNFKLTKAGSRALKTFMDEHGKTPKLRDAETCTNTRYKKSGKGKRKS